MSFLYMYCMGGLFFFTAIVALEADSIKAQAKENGVPLFVFTAATFILCIFGWAFFLAQLTFRGK